MARRGTKATTARARFLERFAATANVTASAALAGVDRRTVYKWRDTDPEFAAAWDDAEQQAADRVEQEILRRAVEGWDEPVYQRGELVGTVRRYSDHLLAMLARAHRPERFAERRELTGAGGSALRIVVDDADGD